MKKYKEIQALSVEELKTQLAQTARSLRGFKFAHAVSPLENPMSIRNLRRQIARIHTEIRAKELVK
jgi:large subunit ribosomal protein L29